MWRSVRTAQGQAFLKRRPQAKSHCTAHQARILHFLLTRMQPLRATCHLQITSCVARRLFSSGGGGDGSLLPNRDVLVDAPSLLGGSPLQRRNPLISTSFPPAGLVCADALSGCFGSQGLHGSGRLHADSNLRGCVMQGGSGGAGNGMQNFFSGGHGQRRPPFLGGATNNSTMGAAPSESAVAECHELLRMQFVRLQLCMCAGSPGALASL